MPDIRGIKQDFEKIIKADSTQQNPRLFMALHNERLSSTGASALAYLNENNMLVKQHIDNIVLTPTPHDEMDLKIYKMIQKYKSEGHSSDEIRTIMKRAGYSEYLRKVDNQMFFNTSDESTDAETHETQKQNESPSQPMFDPSGQALGDKQIADMHRNQALTYENMAKELRAEADKLDPPPKKTRAKRKTTTAKKTPAKKAPAKKAPANANKS